MSFSEARKLNVLRLDTSDVGVPTVKSMVLAMDGAIVSVGGVDGVELNTVTEELNDRARPRTSPRSCASPASA